MTKFLRDSAIRALTTGPSIVDGYSIESVPTGDELDALAKALEAYETNKLVTNRPALNAASCGSVERAGRARKDCHCKRCDEWRDQRNTQLRHEREKRAREGRINQWSSIDLLSLYWEQHGFNPKRCAYCERRPFQHIDHVIPVARGGGSEFSNLLPACPSCNHKKWAHDPIAWVATNYPRRAEAIRAYIARAV